MIRLATFTICALPLVAPVSVVIEATPLSPAATDESAIIQSFTSQRQAEPGHTRFDVMDLNNDGVITRDEWRGSYQSFRVHDWNGDGKLSGEEVRVGGRRMGGYNDQDFDPPAASRFDYWDDASFTNLDHNKDGRLNRKEWHYDAEAFSRADRNGDNFLSKAEFLATDLDDDDRGDDFEYLDLNGDGRVERNEWHAGAASFTRFDRNRDGVLSRAEVVGTTTTDAAAVDAADQFASLDYNGDGRITADEWHWSRPSFDQRDVNHDGALSRREVYNAATGAVGTSGQIVRVDPGQRWTDTGLYVQVGDTITLSADGSIVMSTTDPNDVATPAGARSGRRAQDAPLPQEPAGALIAQIGTSAPMMVGATRTIRATAGGRLYLGVNDDHLPDNSGQFQVTINIQGR